MDIRVNDKWLKFQFWLNYPFRQIALWLSVVSPWCKLVEQCVKHVVLMFLLGLCRSSWREWRYQIIRIRMFLECLSSCMCSVPDNRCPSDCSRPCGTWGVSVSTRSVTAKKKKSSLLFHMWCNRGLVYLTCVKWSKVSTHNNFHRLQAGTIVIWEWTSVKPGYMCFQLSGLHLLFHFASRWVCFASQGWSLEFKLSGRWMRVLQTMWTMRTSLPTTWRTWWSSFSGICPSLCSPASWGRPSSTSTNVRHQNSFHLI